MFHDRPTPTVGTHRRFVAPQTTAQHPSRPTLRRTPRQVGAGVVTG